MRDEIVARAAPLDEAASNLGEQLGEAASGRQSECLIGEATA